MFFYVHQSFRYDSTHPAFLQVGEHSVIQTSIMEAEDGRHFFLKLSLGEIRTRDLPLGKQAPWALSRVEHSYSWFLAHLVMSLCNHALSVVVCRCWRRCHHRRLCTALPVTGLIIKASYLTNICSYAPSICTWNIKSMWCIFLNGGHFSKFLYLALLSTWLNLEPSYLAQLCTYTGATHREEIIHLSIIFLKLWIFKKIHILHFLTHWQTCQRY